MNTKIITLNGKEYEINTNIDFGSIVEMEEYGVDLMSLGQQKQTFTQIRNITAYFLKLDLDEASKEISEHLKNGGKLDFVADLFGVIANSDFFQQAVAQK